MKPLAISVLTICGIEELPGHEERDVTHVLSLLDPDWPEIDAFQRYGAHHRRIFHFHDIIEQVPGRIAPTPDDMAAILQFGAELQAAKEGRAEGHLLVHCHMGVSRSTAAMLTLLAQAYPDEGEDRLFARLREIRPQAWPNSLMVGYADEQLGRGGRLTAALRQHYGHRLRREPEVADWMTGLGRAREVEMAIG
jgi:predicted protein tyrosine phosphatase